MIRNCNICLVWWHPSKFHADASNIDLPKALLEEIFGHMPDVVCLQEVTQPFLSILAQNSYVQMNYTTSDAGMLAAKQQPCCLEGYRQYDVLLLVKNGLKVSACFFLHPLRLLLTRGCC